MNQETWCETIEFVSTRGTRIHIRVHCMYHHSSCVYVFQDYRRGESQVVFTEEARRDRRRRSTNSFNDRDKTRENEKVSQSIHIRMTRDTHGKSLSLFRQKLWYLLPDEIKEGKTRVFSVRRTVIELLRLSMKWDEMRDALTSQKEKGKKKTKMMLRTCLLALHSHDLIKSFLFSSSLSLYPFSVSFPMKRHHPCSSSSSDKISATVHFSLPRFHIFSSFSLFMTWSVFPLDFSLVLSFTYSTDIRRVIAVILTVTPIALLHDQEIGREGEIEEERMRVKEENSRIKEERAYRSPSSVIHVSP